MSATEVVPASGSNRTTISSMPWDWELRALGPLVRITSGESPSLFHLADSGTPYFKVDQLNNSTKYLGSSETDYFITEPSKTVPHGSILFPKRGASIMLNKVRLLAEDAYMDTNMMALTPQGDIDAEYLFYVLGYIKLSSVADVTSIPQINNKHIAPFEVPYPSLPEQRAIAEALSDVDGLIAALDKLIAKKRAIKQAAMQQLLTGKTRFPGFSGEWKTKRLGDVLTVRHGRSQRDVAATGGKYPILASGGEIGRTDSFLYDKPSVLIGRKGTIDEPQFVSTPFWTVDTLFFTEIGTHANAKFIFYKFCMIRWRSYNEASGVPSLNARTIENIEICVPCVREQTAIATALSDIDAEIEALERRRDKTKQIKRGMMQQLLTGRIRLVKPEMESGHD